MSPQEIYSEDNQVTDHERLEPPFPHSRPIYFEYFLEVMFNDVKNNLAKRHELNF